MNKSDLITNYEFEHNLYQNIHSAGPDIFFHHPCIGYIKKGYAKFLYKGDTLYAYEGDLIYIAYETRYQSIWFGSPDIEWYTLNFDFNSKYAFYNYRFQILKNYSGKIFEKIRETYEKFPLLSISYFYQLLNDVYNKLENIPISPFYETVVPAISFIENKYNEPLSIESLAKLCNCSESSFFKLFKKATGVTPITYKHNIMIQHAVDLLSNTSFSVEEISTQVGFMSSNYFRKVFFKLTDKKPNELRRK